MDNDSYQLLIDYALKLISFRPRAKKELSGKLYQYSIKRGISKDILDKVVSDLEQRNLINDQDFIAWWIDQRDTFRPKGKSLLKLELRQKGISSKDLETYFSTQKNPSSEYEKALVIAQKKYRRYEKLDKLEAKAKLSAFLARRGFEWSVIYSVIDTILKKD